MSDASADLLTALREIRRSVADEGGQQIEHWRSSVELPGFAASAANVAHYLWHSATTTYGRCSAR